MLGIFLLKMFFISLLLTELIELGVACVMGVRSRGGLLIVGLVNMLTNPAAVAGAWIAKLYLPDVPGLGIQLPIEVLVIIAEAAVYRVFGAEEKWTLRHPVRLSLAANAVSWMAGILLQVVV